MIILKNLQGANLYPGDSLSLFCFIPAHTIQMSILGLLRVLPEADTKIV